MDLDGYFARIGYDGPRTPTVDVLSALMMAHVRTIPFENIDVLASRPVELGTDALYRKLVTARRGGYCFEQNGLFLVVLEALGFDVTPLSARVRLDRPRDFTPARTHVLLRVVVAGVPWLADVGVGAASLTAPIRFDVQGEQPTPHEARRLVHEDGRWFHQIRYGERWADVYELTGEAMPLIDRVVANWYTSTHPQSHFKDRFMVARAATDGGRVTMLNDKLTRRGRDGIATSRTVDEGELRTVLGEEFGIVLPDDVRFAVPAATP